MDNLLINSSVAGDSSPSPALARDADIRLLDAYLQAAATDRDVATAPVPRLTPAAVDGIRSAAAPAAEAASFGGERLRSLLSDLIKRTRGR